MEVVQRLVAPNGAFAALAVFIGNFNAHATRAQHASGGKECGFPFDFLHKHCAGLVAALGAQAVGDVHDFLSNFDVCADQLSIREHWPWRTILDSAHGMGRRLAFLGGPGSTAEALQQEKRRTGAAQHFLGAMVTAQQRDEGAKQYLLCLSRYQDRMRKPYLSHRHPARSLELLAETRWCSHTASTRFKAVGSAGG